MPEVIFVCPKKPQAVITVKSAFTVNHPDGSSSITPGIRVGFIPNEYGVGEYRTSDPKVIKFLREHLWFQKGAIEIAGESVPAERPPRVVQGVLSSKEPEAPTPPAPEDVPRYPKAAKVPKRRGRPVAA